MEDGEWYRVNLVESAVLTLFVSIVFYFMSLSLSGCLSIVQCGKWFLSGKPRTEARMNEFRLSLDLHAET